MEIKGIVHVHSTYSYDGKESLSSLRELLMQKGLSFCFLTEHTDEMTMEKAQMFVQECRSLSGSQFVFIPGFEVPYKDAHILLIGTEMFMGQKADAQILRAWSERAHLTVLAHPVRNKFTIDETILSAIDAVEIWNQQYEGKRVPRVRSSEFLRELQSRKPELIATGGTDFHRREHLGSPFFTLEVEHVTIDAITDALAHGAYTFGNNKVAVSSTGLWKGKGSFAHIVMSHYSVAFIAFGKGVNKLLARFGLGLPKGLRSFIRARI
jgi:predicted metal-dependent phosphoesterase TrpH